MVFLEERTIYPAYKISFLNNKTATVSEDRHPITQNSIFRGGHLGLRQCDVTTRDFRGSYRIPLTELNITGVAIWLPF